ncbi:MAG: hypothetical protein WBH20_09355 [Oceanisphaera sp.]|uniref:hypothetical protein n=1 Tax=Oceanisphaera sp. TaxID=1929979 RepID=UPI003C74629E
MNYEFTFKSTSGLFTPVVEEDYQHHLTDKIQAAYDSYENISNVQKHMVPTCYKKIITNDARAAMNDLKQLFSKGYEILTTPNSLMLYTSSYTIYLKESASATKAGRAQEKAKCVKEFKKHIELLEQSRISSIHSQAAAVVTDREATKQREINKLQQEELLLAKQAELIAHSKQLKEGK